MGAGASARLRYKVFGSTTQAPGEPCGFRELGGGELPFSSCSGTLVVLSRGGVFNHRWLTPPAEILVGLAGVVVEVSGVVGD